MKKLVVIDGKSVFYRGYYAMRNLSLKDGTPVGGVYGFTVMALEVIKNLDPDYIAIAWDKSQTNIRSRRKIYPEYKANRKKAPDDFYVQIPILHQLLEAFGWPLYEFDDYEADDIIGTFAREVHGRDISVDIISSDLDMLQVVNDTTHLYALKRGFSQIEKFDIAALESKYGIKKEQFLDFKALAGDTSDNIPGAAGIGKKTATDLLQQYGDIENIYQNIDNIKPAWANKLEAGRELVKISKELAEIKCDAPLKFNPKQMMARDIDTAKLRAKLEELEFYSLIKRLPEYMQTDDLPVAEKTLPKIKIPDDFTIIKNNIGQIALHNKEFFIAHNVKKFFANYDETYLDFIGKKIKVFDTELAGFLLDSLRKPIIEILTAEEIYERFIELNSQLVKLPKLNKLAQEVDFPLQILLADIEKRGVKLDVPTLGFMSVDLYQKMKKLESEIYSLTGQEFNISSPAQLSDVLFNHLNLPTKNIKKTTRGYSTGANELVKLRAHHQVIGFIEEYRTLSKLKSTYIDALPKLVDENNYLHTNFRQDATQTGRLSSSEPNLQNIPIRTPLGRELRKSFVASAGKVIINADYSQFELRLAAVLSDDKQLIDDFKHDIDIHTKTASTVFAKDIQEVTDQERRIAKTVNFGVIYGLSPRGLAEATGMNYAQAKDFIDKYFEIHTSFKKYIEKTLEQASSEGYVETVFGRRRLTPDVNSANFIVRESARRAAINMPIQGTEADLMKMAMLRIEKEIPEAKQFMQIHDSIMVETSAELAESVGAKMKNIMENIYPDLGVQLKVDIAIGENWGDL